MDTHLLTLLCEALSFGWASQGPLHKNNSTSASRCNLVPFVYLSRGHLGSHTGVWSVSFKIIVSHSLSSNHIRWSIMCRMSQAGGLWMLTASFLTRAQSFLRTLIHWDNFSTCSQTLSFQKCSFWILATNLNFWQYKNQRYSHLQTMQCTDCRPLRILTKYSSKHMVHKGAVLGRSIIRCVLGFLTAPGQAAACFTLFSHSLSHLCCWFALDLPLQTGFTFAMHWSQMYMCSEHSWTRKVLVTLGKVMYKAGNMWRYTRIYVQYKLIGCKLSHKMNARGTNYR